MNRTLTLRFIFCFVSFLVCIISKAQFAIIHDSDGFSNVRKSPSKDSAVISKLVNGHLIYCLDFPGNWTNIDYADDKHELNGYIYNNRYTYVSSFSLIPERSHTKNTIQFAGNDIEVTLTSQAFEKTKHTFKYSDQFLSLIDGKKFYGTDGEMPSSEYSSIKLKIGNKEIQLPKEAHENLYQPNLFATRINYDTAKNIIYIQSMNSDGSGSYEVIWKIENGVYKERFIAYGF